MAGASMASPEASCAEADSVVVSPTAISALEALSFNETGAPTTVTVHRAL